MIPYPTDTLPMIGAFKVGDRVVEWLNGRVVSRCLTVTHVHPGKTPRHSDRLVCEFDSGFGFVDGPAYTFTREVPA